MAPSLSRTATALSIVVAMLASSVTARANDTGPTLPPAPAPMNVPAPGPMTDGPYQPQPIVPGGVVIPLYAPDSPAVNHARIREAEVYHSYHPGEIGYVVNIHNPSIEFHAGDGQLNTGAVVILAAGGAHRVLNVGPEGADFVHFFKGYGISTVILRNRLRSDGYNPETDGVRDAEQAIKLVRAHAQEWHLDPHKVGIVGFSAGAELAAAAALRYEAFDAQENVASNPLAAVSSRPDFVGIIYPGPSPFANGGNPPIPLDVPPVFFATAGSGDWQHAIWATEFFTALLKDHAPNVEMHVYARGHHPGDKVPAGEPPATGGLSDRGFIAFGTWQERFIDWFKDLGFFNPPGVETVAARDAAAHREHH